MSKGDNRRPSQVSEKTMEDNWKRTFGVVDKPVKCRHRIKCTCEDKEKHDGVHACQLCGKEFVNARALTKKAG